MTAGAQVRFEVVDPLDDRAVTALTAYFEELEERFTTGFEPGDTLVADAPKFRQPVGAFVIATDAGRTIGCGAVSTLDDSVCEIKRMWVSAEWRGHGVGRLLLAELERQCCRLGGDLVRLDTNSALTEAIAMYEGAGYQSIERYNDNPYAKHWFEKDGDR